jgi:hypothetical protein
MLFLTTEMVAPQMTAAQKIRYDTARRALAEEGLPLGSRPGRRPRRTGRLSRLIAWLEYRVIGVGRCLARRPKVVEGARARL